MKIVVAPDSFKGNMRSEMICRIIRDTVLQECPGADVRTVPMADGGEGTVEAMVAATGGSMHSRVVCGPLGDEVEAQYGLLPDGTAVMEMAAASGIELIPAARLNPLEASTYGTGELMRHLLESGHRSLVMGIGGSATVDGGTGMAQALGIVFADASGNNIRERGGRILAHIHAIDPSRVIPELASAEIRVACDVANPLTGLNGAARVFGSQKGATPDMVAELEKGLGNIASIAGLNEQPGDGAAGGLGYGLRFFCGARIVPGARLIAETVGLPDILAGADLLITGEGRTDGQTASGKLCSVLADMARERGVRTMLLSGALAGDLDGFLDLFDFAFSISAGHASLEECIAHAPEDLAFTVRNAIRLLKAH